ncbi:hypothetical protein [Variovorax gossypii]
MTAHLIEDAIRYCVGGTIYTGHQLLWATYCAHSVARAYEIADEANGGDGSVDWSDIDDAQREAADAMGADAMKEIVSDARIFNGLDGNDEEDGVDLCGEEPAVSRLAPLAAKVAETEIQDAIADVNKRYNPGEDGYGHALVTKGIQLTQAHAKVSASQAGDPALKVAPTDASSAYDPNGGQPGQADFLHALALLWKSRREVQELKVGTVKHATRQFEFFAGALAAADALGHPYNPMVLILLNGADAVEVFAKVDLPKGAS